MGGIVEKVAFPAPPREELEEVYQYSRVGRGRLVPYSGRGTNHGRKEVEIQLVWLHNQFGHAFPVLWFRPRAPTFRDIVMIYSHGNAEDIFQEGAVYNNIDVCRTLGVSIFAYEYSGYSWSLNATDPTQPLIPRAVFCIANIDATFEYLTQELNILAGNIIVYGKSVGSGPTTDFSSRHPEIRGTLLQSPIASAVRVATTTAPFTPFFDIFPNIDKVDKIKSPTLIVHGTDDEVVPFVHGQQLFEKLNCIPKRNLWIEGAYHNDIECNHWTVFADCIAAFLKEVAAMPLPAPPPPVEESSFFSWFSASVRTS